MKVFMPTYRIVVCGKEMIICSHIGKVEGERLILRTVDGIVGGIFRLASIEILEVIPEEKLNRSI